jgi:hypothetical protein
MDFDPQLLFIAYDLQVEKNKEEYEQYLVQKVEEEYAKALDAKITELRFRLGDHGPLMTHVDMQEYSADYIYGRIADILGPRYKTELRNFTVYAQALRPPPPPTAQ